MAIWSSEIKELERLHESFKGQLPDLEKELERLVKADDENMILLYSRRCLEVIITDLCECQLKRERGTEPLKGIIDKLNKEKKVPSHIITSMHGLNDLSTYGTHPKDFDPEQIKPVLNNLDIIIKWYLNYKKAETDIKPKPYDELSQEIQRTKDVKKSIQIPMKRLTGLLAGLILLIVILVAVFFFTNIIGSGKQTKELEKSIAVLPFINDSPVDSNKYFINGIMEEVLNNLQKIKEFRVLSRTSTDQYKGQDRPTIPEIVKKLGVSYIVEGSGQKYGNTFRLRVQLIKGKGKENHLWAKSYEQEIRETKEIFSIQNEIAQSIASELKATITPEEKQIIEKVPTTNMTAYDLYLKANDYQKEYEKANDLSYYFTAVNLYKAALEIDSAFAKAYTGWANTYLERYQWENFFRQNFLDTCLVLINKAISLDDQLDEAYYLKGNCYLANGHSEEALNNYDKALSINPNYYSAYIPKGYILTYLLNDYIKGIETYPKALNLVSGKDRPNLLRSLGDRYSDIGFFDKANYYYHEAYTLDSDRVSNLNFMSWMEFSNENFEEALKLAKKANEIDSTFLEQLIFYSIPSGHNEEAYLHANKFVEYYKKSGLLNLQQAYRIGYAFWQVGKKKEAENYFNQQIKYSEVSIKFNRGNAQRKAAQYDLAATYAFLGDKKKAYQYLDDFNTLKFYPLWWVSLFKHDPLFNNIRNEERFQKILQNVEAKYQAEHERVRKWLEEQGML